MKSSTEKVDVLVIGAGNAGLTAADVARQAGRSVAVAEHRQVGGTCPLRGCVPKKVLVAAAETLDTIAGAGKHRIDVAAPRLDWPGLIERKEGVIAGTSESLEKHLKDSRIELIRGRACFTDRHVVEIGGRVVSAGKMVISTGSKPRALPIPGAEHIGTSDDVLTLPRLPDSVAFIGGGVIGLEFSHVLARAGSKVTILELTPQILPGVEPELADRLHRASARAGIEVLTSVQVERISRDGEGFRVDYRRGGQLHECRAARVINGAGRIADVEDLHLDAAGIEHEAYRIAVDEYLCSVSHGDVYVAGDAYAGSKQLSPLATEEGQIVGENIVHGNRRSIDYLSIPSAVFTIPALASVGHTERSASEAGLEFESKGTDMSDWFTAELYGGEFDYAKILIEKDSGRILGAHLFGKRSEETIHLFAVAMKYGLTAAQLRQVIYAFPTFSSNVSSML